MDEPKTASDFNQLARQQLELQPDLAMETARKALDLARNEQDKLQEADALRHVGSAYWAFYEYDQALEYYFKALALSEEIGHKSGAASVHNNLALVYNKIDCLDDAEKHLEVAKAAYQELGEDMLLAAVNNNLGKLYENRGMHREALRSHFETLRITQRQGYKPGVLRAKINIGAVYMKAGEYVTADNYFTEALELSIELGFDREQVNSLANRAETLSRARKLREAESQLDALRHRLDTMDYPPGELIYHSARLNYLHAFAEVARQAGDIESAMNAYGGACAEHFEISRLRAKMFNNELSDKIARLHALFEVERKQHEARISQQQTEIYRLENIELVKRQKELEAALADVKLLQGLLPICSNCKNIRDDSGFWRKVEEYISAHSQATFSHSLCPDCLQELYPDVHEELVESGQIKPPEGSDQHE